MTITQKLDLETRSKVTADCFFKPLCMYESDWAERKKGKLWTSDVRWIDGHTDKFKVPAEQSH